jgi:6,7-dimethyl-8-ribityllumazine synthase
MSTFIASRPRQMHQRHAFAIVASQYNPEYVKGLVDHAMQELDALSPGATITTHEVPGAFEIPLVVQEVAARGGVEAIIALGVIIRGETEHADLIGQAVTSALLDAGLRYRIPVVHEVLLLDNEEQARARTLGTELNRGTEAARVAVAMAQKMIELKPR